MTSHKIERSQPIYGMTVEKDLMVATRDEILLATDVYLPTQNGTIVDQAFPVVMERTPYNKEGRGRESMAEYYVSRGYVVVFQDNRGRFKSGGSFTKYLDDGTDGYDTLEWMGKQSWCNGKVGTMGISYGAHTQSALACLNPPYLSCMFLDSGGFSNAYSNAARQGGAFELRQATWAFNNGRVSKEATDNPVIKQALGDIDIKEWFTRMPWKKGHSPLKLIPDYEEYLFQQWTHGDFDEYWKQVGIYAEGFYEQYSDVPMLHMSSWYDPYPKTATDNYTALSKIKTGPVRLLLGPWTHGAHSVTFAGDVEFGPHSTVDGTLADDYNDFKLRWFDQWLKGIENGIKNEKPVRIFVMGGGSGNKDENGRMQHGGQWRDETNWPLTSTIYTNYYLNSDGTLTTNSPDEIIRSTSYNYDPKDPVPTIGGNISSGAPVMEGGAYHQEEESRFFGSTEPYLPLASRHDILVFQTPPLERAIEVTGPITVKLWVSSSCPDTDFTAKLIDSYPPNADYSNGFDMNLCDSILRCRYRDSWEHPEMMSPGDIYPIEINLFPTSNLFKEGHRIRLDISSSNFPHFDVNPNTGEAQGLSRRTQIATNTIYHDSDHRSLIILPIIPRI